MNRINKQSKHYKEINSTVNDFYANMRPEYVEDVYNMLSPNFKNLTLEPRHKKKCQEVFLFHREVAVYAILELTEVNSDFVEAIVKIGLRPENYVKPKGHSNGSGEIEVNFVIYKFRFILLNGFWWVDDLSLYNDYKPAIS
ncbi:hypothetical protein A3860_33760 [Niastella vici]|uniref:Uncharacterized protein n=1 Tax=Niastella vici TaxID=1703345 RepID=A0A1V9FPU3_9BACT|nr:hypothetical protein [Niastella vici]OQP60348.1 hypothetical protein A3860_33760 [Niastella vici]